MKYRRALVPGGTYFFTVVLNDRGSALLTDSIELLREAFVTVRIKHSFNIDAMVVLPEHLHCVWTMPENDSNFALRWRQIKSYFSRKLDKNELIDTSRSNKSERGIWQRRYWEHLIRDEKDMEAHINYVHYNPVKHGYVERACDWPYSSIHKYIRQGVYDENWGVKVESFEGNYGE